MASISLKNITLDFPVYGVSGRSLKKKLLKLSTVGKINYDDGETVVIKALKNINMDLSSGDRVGLIGPNGAGKSSLLRVLTGVYEPLHGEINVSGKVGSLLSLSLGLEPESSGNENITIHCMVNGMKPAEIENKRPKIAEFAGLGDFLSMPCRTYSSGMRLRLAFAIATAIEPEILILDEVVGVGDSTFLDKAKKRINSIIEKSKIVVLASHDKEIIKSICNKIIVLKDGEIQFTGAVDEGLAFYENSP